MCIAHTRRTLPAPAPATTSLMLIGALRAPGVWTLDELRELPSTTLRVTLICDACALDPRRWQTRDWHGVRLAPLLAAAGLSAGANSLQIAGYDGRLTHLALDDVQDALLAWAADGLPLSAEQGFPARLIVPGQSACAMPRFMQRLSVVRTAAAPLAAAAPRAVITEARQRPGGVGIRLAGWGFGGAAALEQVALRLDGGAPVFAAVRGGGPGLAGDWSLDWPGAVDSGAQFTVQPVHNGAAGAPEAGRQLARRWRPEVHAVRVAER